MDVQKVFIGGKKEVVISCPHCGKTKTIEVAAIKHIRKPIRVKCGCAATFNIVLEERKYYRKATCLAGSCSRVGHNDPEMPITIENLSRTGLGFVVHGMPSNVGSIKIDDRLNLKFSLDNNRKASIRATAIVRFIRDNYFGAEFHGLDEHAMKELGFYLMP